MLSLFSDWLSNLKQKSFWSLFGFFYFRIYLIILAGLNVLLCLAAHFIYINVSQELVILHYNVDFGVNLIGNVKNVFIIPTLGFAIIIANLIVAFISFRQKDSKFINHLLLGSAIMVQILLLASLAAIYLINFR